MIPQQSIIEWSAIAPWKANEQVEQDLIICRSLVEIFSDKYIADRLAFRAGTALHKLFIKLQSRYSEDIDLVQISEGSFGPAIDKIREILSFPGKPKISQKDRNNTMVFKFVSEMQPGGIPARDAYLKNLEDKMNDPEFLGDTTALLRPDETYDPMQQKNLAELMKNSILRKQGRSIFLHTSKVR
jgi:Nucleotidyl transferase AbiEii toxin, Type IV TA system